LCWHGTKQNVRSSAAFVVLAEQLRTGLAKSNSTEMHTSTSLVLKFFRVPLVILTVTMTFGSPGLPSMSSLLTVPRSALVTLNFGPSS
jgi:hypothetical protein